MMFMPLDESERLTTGSVVGIDAEFVTLNQVGGLGSCGGPVIQMR